MIRLSEFNHITGKIQEKNAVFVEYDNENKTYSVLVDGRSVTYTEHYFNIIFCGFVAEKHVQTNIVQQKKKSFSDELNIEGLGLAWTWYVFIMLVAIIFKDRIAIWIFASYIFFNYRGTKLKEAGYK